MLIKVFFNTSRTKQRALLMALLATRTVDIKKKILLCPPPKGRKGKSLLILTHTYGL